MAFVVDVSVAGCWLLPDEGEEVAAAAWLALEQDDALVPDLFWHELRNLLLSAERRQRLASGEAEVALAMLRLLPLVSAALVDDGTVFSLARRYRLSAYDAVYLALALDRGVPLATLDKRLAAAARTEGCGFA